MTGALSVRLEFIPGARAPFRRSPARKAPETDLTRKAIRP